MRSFKSIILASILIPSVTAAAPDHHIFAAQVLLDRIGFGPGVIDGASGANFAKALSGYQTAKGLPVTGKLDPATAQSFAPFRAMPTVIDVTLNDEILEGPFVGPLPEEEADKAKLTQAWASRLRSPSSQTSKAPNTNGARPACPSCNAIGFSGLSVSRLCCGIGWSLTI